MTLNRKIEHNEKVCRAQELGSYAQGQGRNQVKGQIVPKNCAAHKLLKQFDETSQKGNSPGAEICSYARKHFRSP